MVSKSFRSMPEQTCFFNDHNALFMLTHHYFLESAYDSTNPYFDPKSTRDAPKWCVVQVEFRQKFPRMITLKELQRFAQPGGALQEMQTLKQSRLSVSKVSKEEYDFIMSLVEEDES
jgi:predicted RNA-binding protein with PUA-like domain